MNRKEKDNLHGQPQCLRKTTIVGLSGSFNFSWVGAGSPTLGTGAVSFAGGDLKDWSSFVNNSVRVGAIVVRRLLAGRLAKDYGSNAKMV
jgi:hypothetical protein